jgi:two-component system chemotaxis response regulator CheB
MKRGDATAIPAETREPGPPRLTGVTCPACSGVLSAQNEGGSLLVFACRIGHAFSVAELVMDEEQHVEHMLWRAVSALEELAATLRDLGSDPERVRQAAADADAIRRIIQRTRPAQLGEP